ncbi:hypothetical protein [Erwinia mallotivora]|uniref:hypothetical protein n=1 Tax=Erwinia mallotivora TaxID=69222 RepID=UPI001268A160|nr:hypothetical protein [Erwinia mallotivora]
MTAFFCVLARFSLPRHICSFSRSERVKKRRVNSSTTEFVGDVRLTLAAEEFKGVTLGGAARQGFSSWLGSPAQPQPRKDLIFSPEPAERIGI